MTRILAVLVLALACRSSSVEQQIAYGNPDGYTVHALMGASLLSTDVALNGVKLDPSSPEAIDASIREMVASPQAPHTVDVLEGVGPADLTADFTASRPLPPHFYGGNIQWYSKFSFDLPVYRALVRNLRVDRMRFPAGLERGEYARHATPSLADDLGHERFRLTGPDVASFISLCRESGIAAEPQVNTAEDHPEMWADLVDQIVNELGYDLRDVAAGNEADYDGTRSPWSLYGATSLDEALASYTGRYLRYRKAIDAVKPGLTYVYGEFAAASGVTGQAVPLLGGDEPGAVAVHWYATGEMGEPPTDPYYPSFDHLNGSMIHDALDGILADLRDATRTLDHPELVLGEFATSWSNSVNAKTVQDTLGTALFDAEVHEYAKAIGFDEVAYWSLSDPAAWEPWATALIAIEGTRMRVRPQYYVHLLYKHLYADQIVDVPGGQTRDWSIYAARDAAHAYLLLVNRSPGQAVQKVVRAKTAAGERRLGLTLYPHSLAVVRF